MIIIIGLAAIVSTLLGGLFAIRFKDKLHLILGFSAGTVVGVALFDLLPESISLTSKYFKITTATTLIAVGFAIFMIIDRWLNFHIHRDEDHDDGKESQLDFHGAITLAAHSFLDGLGIGLAFKVSPAVGAVVAAAVLAHDFSDGINTVNYILKNNGRSKTAVLWLIVDAVAPFLGIISAFFIKVSDGILGLVLALFCGFFLYIGASDLLPESHHRHPRAMTTILTLLGMFLIFVAVHLAG